VRLLLQAAIVLSLLITNVGAQDPLKVAPQAYQLEFENEWLRVIRVHYGPRVKIPVHDHTQWAAAYVYLNDSAQIIFKHIGPESSSITRPPTKAGSFRLYKAISEVHEVENPTDTPSSFLRVEFKTEPLGEATLRGRYYREAYPVRENYKKVQFENEQIRATRLICAPGQTLMLTGNLSGPALVVALTPVRLRAFDQKNSSTRLELEAGKTKWFGSNQPTRLENPGNEPAEVIRFELKTKPISSP
jgi:hypothetical protein